ncbi:MAG: ORF6N domain-containing protein [Phycisphaerae bacterium]|nr:ORF6N domain-containing protein [Phycisphaerae bacterium]
MSPERAGGRHALVTAERTESRIVTIRGCRVMIDTELAELYGVPVKRLNEQVKRNAERFPPDFAFQISREERDGLRSQFATLERGRGEHRKYLPWAFTEHGAIMAANVLNSRRAVEASVFVVRAFVRLRGMLANHKELARKLMELERKVGSHDEAIRGLVAAIRRLAEPPLDPPRRRIGFHRGDP